MAIALHMHTRMHTESAGGRKQDRPFDGPPFVPTSPASEDEGELMMRWTRRALALDLLGDIPYECRLARVEPVLGGTRVLVRSQREGRGLAV